MTGLAFIDTETTGLDADVHEVWEVAAIIDDSEYTWQLPVDLGRADPVALRIGRFHERRASTLSDVGKFARAFAKFTRGRHLVGAVVSFDEERLRKLLRGNGACPEWHYHLIDVEALAVGFICGFPAGAGAVARSLPWHSEELSRALGVDPKCFDRHTAIGDARWAKALYEAVTK